MACVSGHTCICDAWSEGPSSSSSFSVMMNYQEAFPGFVPTFLDGKQILSVLLWLLCVGLRERRRGVGDVLGDVKEETVINNHVTFVWRVFFKEEHGSSDVK